MQNESTEDKASDAVSGRDEPVVSRPLWIRGTSPYSFRTGEWAVVIDVQNVTPKNLDERAVYICKYSDGFEDQIAICDDANYELG